MDLILKYMDIHLLRRVIQPSRPLLDIPISTLMSNDNDNNNVLNATAHSHIDIHSLEKDMMAHDYTRSLILADPFRWFFVSWMFTYVAALILYFVICTITYYRYFKRKNYSAWKGDAPDQIINEIWTSIWSLFIMSGLTQVLEIPLLLGYGRIYHSLSDYGVLYLPLSLILFVLFSDSLIYWLHRWLHHPKLYFLHKLHHRYKETTPFSAFSFHPIDGWIQSLPYHFFPMLFPMHHVLYQVLLFGVGLWTINIHDRVTFNWWGVNGAAHHTFHHTKFNFNYGQYFTFWDRVFKTYMEPMDRFPYTQEPYLSLNNNQAKSKKL